MRPLKTLVSAVLGIVMATSSAFAEVKSQEVLSPVYLVKEKYRSMKGPASIRPLRFNESMNELLWVTAYRAQIVGEDGQSPVSQEFMCHTNFDYNPEQHSNLFKWSKVTSARLFTLSQGLFEIKFPKGFGIPLLSDEKMFLSSQVLNHNFEKPNIKVRHKLTLDYIRDKDLKGPMKPLFMVVAVGMVLLKGNTRHYNTEGADPLKHGEGCMVGVAAMKSSQYTDSTGSRFSGHWVIPPGRHEYKMLATRYMNIPYDTTAHYIAAHVHPFCEFIEMRDLTANKTVFRSNIKAPEGRIGIDHLETFSSEEGIPVYKDHEYELVTAYNNTSGVDQDSMAVMYLYLLDKDPIQKPTLWHRAKHLGQRAIAKAKRIMAKKLAKQT